MNGERIPVWAADYVLADYGTGAIMAVPAHDQRDLDFARAFGLPVRVVVDTGEPDPAETGVATAGDGVLVNSGPLRRAAQGRRRSRASRASWRSAAAGTARVNYRLRDWLISRQRYWGAPIPIVHCPACGEVPVPDDQLPVALPDLRGAGPGAEGRRRRWPRRPTGCATTCPRCGGAGVARHRHDGHLRRLVLVLPALLLARPRRRPVRPGRAARGGCRSTSTSAASSTRSCTCCTAASSPRCCTTWAWSTSPSRSRALLNQGQVINQGKAMSKSLGNGVDLGEELAAHGVDAVRLTMVFAGPPEDDIDWADVSPAGSGKFLARAWRLARDVDVGARRRTRPPATPRCGRRRTAPSTRSARWSRRSASTSPSPG